VLLARTLPSAAAPSAPPSVAPRVKGTARQHLR